MKLVDGFIFHDVGDKTMLVSTNESKDAFHGMIKLNETGKFIAEALKEDTTVDQIVNSMLEVYNVDEPTARNAVEGFIAELRKINAIID